MNITERFLLNNHPSFVWCRNFWGAEMSLANLRSFVTKDIREAPVFYTQVRGESRVTSFFSLDHVVQSPSTSQGADVGWIETLSFWLNLPSIETELFLLVGCLVGWNPIYTVRLGRWKKPWRKRTSHCLRMHPSQRSQSKLDMLDVWVTDFCLADWEIGQIINPIFWKDFRYSSTRGIQKIWWSETFHQKKQWCINSDASVRSLVWCDSFFCDSHGFMMDLWPLLWLSPAPGQDPPDLRIWQGYEEGKISTTWFPWWLDFAGKDSRTFGKPTSTWSHSSTST